MLIGKEIDTADWAQADSRRLGMKAAEASREEIRELLAGYDMVFVCAGMGGGTGGGAAPVVAQLAKEQGSLVVAFVTYPFSLERSRKVKADWSLQQLSKNADTTIVIENDRLMSYAPNLQMEKSFELIDSIATNAVKGIADTIMLPSLINLDFADVRSRHARRRHRRDKPRLRPWIRQGGEGDKVYANHPMLDVDLEGAKSAMVHVTGSDSLTIEEATRVGAGVTDNLDAKANVIFGARLIPEMGDQIKVMSIVTGVKPRFGTAKIDSERGCRHELRCRHRDDIKQAERSASSFFLF